MGLVIFIAWVGSNQGALPLGFFPGPAKNGLLAVRSLLSCPSCDVDRLLLSPLAYAPGEPGAWLLALLMDGLIHEVYPEDPRDVPPEIRCMILAYKLAPPTHGLYGPA